MFWKKPARQKNAVLDSWSMLAWARPSENYVPWVELDPKRSFKHYFDNKKNGLLEFEDEWSVIPTQKELDSVLEVIWNRADGLARTYFSDTHSDVPSRLALQFTQQDVDAFLLQPFLLPTQQSAFVFSKPRPVQLDLSLNILFADPARSEQVFSEKKQAWIRQLDVDSLDQYLMQQATLMLKHKIHESAKSQHFETLIDILNHFDQDIQANQKQTSQQYLKSIWRVPAFVFADQPEQGVMTMLRTQRAFIQFRTKLYTQILPYYLAEYVSWVLSKPFDAAEMEDLKHCFAHGNGRDQLDFRADVFRLYKHILERCGVPVELSHLFGAEVFLERVLRALSDLPATDEHVFAHLNNRALYTLLLEDVVRYAIHATSPEIPQPEMLLQTLIRLIVMRLATFQAHRNQTEQEMAKLVQEL